MLYLNIDFCVFCPTTHLNEIMFVFKSVQQLESLERHIFWQKICHSEWWFVRKKYEFEKWPVKNFD